MPVIYFALTGTAHFRGDFIVANQYGEKGIELSQTQERDSQTLLFGYEPKMALMAYCGHTLWLIGYPDQAQTIIQKAVALAVSTKHPGNILFSLSFQLVLKQFRGEVLSTLDLAERIIDDAAEKVIPQWIAHAKLFHGWALVQEGMLARGIEEQRQGLGSLKEMGAGLGLTYYLLLLAESCTVSGRLDEGLKAVTEALAIVRAGREGCFEAELHRWRGELILAKGGDDLEAEACFQQALKTASGQQARSFELRAATSLSRLWQQQGKHAEAYQILAEVYNWFTEGFETADLRQAQAQLKSLT